MKRSISFTGQRVLLTAGGLGDWIGLKAQWPDHFAPESIHCLMSSICLAVSLWWDRGGGIRSSVSLVVMRRYISLSAVLPGLMTATPSSTRNALSFWSRLSLALLAFSSGPWH